MAPEDLPITEGDIAELEARMAALQERVRRAEDFLNAKLGNAQAESEQERFLMRLEVFHAFVPWKAPKVTTRRDLAAFHGRIDAMERRLASAEKKLLMNPPVV